jgi:hypothetical protein
MQRINNRYKYTLLCFNINNNNNKLTCLHKCTFSQIHANSSYMRQSFIPIEKLLFCICWAEGILPLSENTNDKNYCRDWITFWQNLKSLRAKLLNRKTVSSFDETASALKISMSIRLILWAPWFSLHRYVAVSVRQLISHTPKHFCLVPFVTLISFCVVPERASSPQKLQMCLKNL